MNVVESNEKLKSLKIRLSKKIDKAVNLGIMFHKYGTERCTIGSERISVLKNAARITLEQKDGLVQVFDDTTDEEFEQLLDEEILKKEKIKNSNEYVYMDILRKKNIFN